VQVFFLASEKSSDAKFEEWVSGFWSGSLDELEPVRTARSSPSSMHAQ